MDTNQLFSIGLGLEAPWRIASSNLDINEIPHRLDLRIEAERGALYPCPECSKPCKAHDFTERTWRHLNFFQHHCYVTAPVPRTDCPEHGIKTVTVPWARKGSAFTMFFEAMVMLLGRVVELLHLQPATILLRPRDLALEATPVAQQKGCESLAGLLPQVRGVFPRTAEVAQGLLVEAGHRGENRCATRATSRRKVRPCCLRRALSNTAGHHADITRT